MYSFTSCETLVREYIRIVILIGSIGHVDWNLEFPITTASGRPPVWSVRKLRICSSLQTRSSDGAV